MAQVLRAMGYYAATAPSNLDAAIIYNAISSADKSLSQPWCSHTNTIYNAQLQKTIVTIVLRMQPRHQATFMQPSQCILRHDVAGNTRWQQSCSHSNAICNHRFKKRIEHAHKNHALQNTEEEPITLGTTPAATAPHRRYLSSPAAATLHGKTQAAFCSTTYTSMQPLHCDLHPFVPEHRGGTDWHRNDPNRNRRTQEVPFVAACSDFTRKNARFRAPASSPTQAPCNMQHSCSHHNAFCSMTWLTRMYLRTWQHQMTKIMQPSQCDLQPPTQETNGTMRTGTTTRCRTQRRNRLRSERPQPQPPHTGGTFHRQLQPLYTEKRKVSCSGFLPNTSPMQHATFMQPSQCILQHDMANPHVSTHMATPDDNNHAAIPMRSATTDSRNE